MKDESVNMPVLEAAMDVIGLFLVFVMIISIWWVSGLWGWVFPVKYVPVLIGITLANYTVQLFTKKDFDRAFETSLFQILAVALCVFLATE